MDWIKRNLFFFVGSLVAVLMLGAAGFYLYTRWQLNNEKLEKWNADSAELQRLNQENPHPGAGQVDNIKAAKEQQQQVKDIIAKTHKYFQPIPALPDSTNVTSQEFTAALRRMIDHLQKEATNASVTLPSDYSFSFTAQKPRVTFSPGSLQPLSVQLGEVQVIASILFRAKVNSLDNIRRVRVSPDDAGGPQTEYLLKKSTTNELAILTPYELTFRCFSAELGSVLAEFGNSPHGFLVKSLNVEPAPAATMDPNAPIATATPIYVPTAVPTAPRPGLPDAEAASAFARRYGLGGPGPLSRGAAERGLPPPRPMPQPTPPPTYMTPGVPQQPAAGKGGFQTVLDEKQLKVTMNLEIIKLLPTK